MEIYLYHLFIELWYLKKINEIFFKVQGCIMENLGQILEKNLNNWVIVELSHRHTKGD